VGAIFWGRLFHLCRAWILDPAPLPGGFFMYWGAGRPGVVVPQFLRAAKNFERKLVSLTLYRLKIQSPGPWGGRAPLFWTIVPGISFCRELVLCSVYISF